MAFTSLNPLNEERVLEDLNYKLIKGYGTRLTINQIKKIEENKYRVSFNYNKVFNVIDERDKKVYVRNIFFEDIYVKEISPKEELKIPINEVNKAIDSEFIGLRNNLFQEVVSNKKIIMCILKNVHTTSAFLNKFYTLLRDLAYEDIIAPGELNNYLQSDKRYAKYIDLVIDSGFAGYNSSGGLKASSTFKKMMERDKSFSIAIEEGVSKIVSDNYDYIIHELGLRQIKPYVDIVSSLYYVNRYIKLKRPIQISELYKMHERLFGATQYTGFKEKINSLVASDIFIRRKDTVSLAMN